MSSAYPVPHVVLLGLLGTWSCGTAGLEQARHRFLHQVEHQALLAACRELLRQDRIDHPRPERRERADISRDPTDPTIPKAIRQLAPDRITVDEEYVRLTFFPGGYHHIDIVGFRGGPDEAKWATLIGEGRRLLPGLWYYEDVNE